MASSEDKLKELRKRRQSAMAGGGKERVKKIHDSGRLTARERINLLFDPGTFQEMGVFVAHNCHDFGMEKNKILGDGVVAGHGSINGRLTYAFAQDFTVFGGTLSEANAGKICRLMDQAVQNGAPVVGLNDSGGARIQEGVASLGGYAEIFWRNTMASGVVPQISAVMGPCAGGAVYSPAITDFIVMVDQTSHMFVTGPNVIKMVTNEEVSFEDLGGARTHNTKSGVAHLMAKNDQDCIIQIRRLLSYMPQNNLSDPPRKDTGDDPGRMEDALNSIVPDSPKEPYDIVEAVKHVVDNGEFLEIHWTSNRHRRAPASFVFATHSTSPSSRSKTSPAFCQAPSRNSAASSSTGQSCCMLTARPRCPRLPLLRAKPTEALTTS